MQKNANRRIFLLFSAVFISTAGCAPPAKIWNDKDELPLLYAVLTKPVKDVEDFDKSYGFSFPRTPEARYSDQPPFDSDGHAIDIARAWLKEFFGLLPEGVSLEPYDDHRSGVALREFVHGIPTTGRASIAIKNGKVVSAYVELWKFTAIPNTYKVAVPQSVARAAWREVFAKQGWSEDKLAKYDRDVSPVLHYVWSPIGYSQWAKEHDDVFSPTWVLGEESLLMVDSHSGKPWLDD